VVPKDDIESVWKSKNTFWCRNL